MENTIKYRNKTIHTVVIPKGTLLFRVVQNPDSDFTGVQNCIPPHYNVYFYFNPFAWRGLSDEHKKDVSNVRVYELINDVKVAYLLKPSKNTRADARRLTKKIFLIKCSTARKSCVTGRKYDTCFDEKFMEKYPDILGYIGLSTNDSKSLRGLMKKELKDMAKYIQITEDNRDFKGSPELVVYPFKKRMFEEVHVQNKDDYSYNYKYVTTLPVDPPKLVSYLENHTTRNQENGFYYHKE